MIRSRPPIKQKLFGSVPLLISKEVNYNDTGISSGKDWFTLRFKTKAPVYVEIWAEIIVYFNAATTNVLTLGTTAGTPYTDIFGAGDLVEGILDFYPTNDTKIQIRYPTPSLPNATSVTIGYKYTQSGTAATQGKARFYARITGCENCEQA